MKFSIFERKMTSLELEDARIIHKFNGKNPKYLEVQTEDGIDIL